MRTENSNGNPALTIALARADALANRGDTDAALSLWHEIRQSHPTDPEPWLQPAAALRVRQRTGEAEALLTEAIFRFPADPRAFMEFADIAERHHNWREAAVRWEETRTRFPNQSIAYVRGAAMLRELGDFERAEQLLDAARARFPNDPASLVAWATLPERFGDLRETIHRCEGARIRFPDEVGPYVVGGVALRDLGRLDEAEILLTSACTRFPNQPAPLVEWCTLAERRGAWEEAARRCGLARARFPGVSVPYVLGTKALRELNRIAEAEALLSEAAWRFPGDPGVFIERASLAAAGERWEEALRHWQTVAEKLPHLPGGPIGAAVALCRLGRNVEADEIVEAAMTRLPTNQPLVEQHGFNAIARGDWPVALERWRRALIRFPGSDTIRRHLYNAQLRVADAGGAPAPVPDVPVSSNDRELVLNFESLGGGGHGCEFGIFQRAVGAEPLGLLRWADVYPDQITAALETGLAGVGEPEFTRIIVPDHNERPEYWTTDVRYHMAMRSFVLVEDVPMERMTRMVTLRQRFLRQKLLDDLQAGTKIFVYKNLISNLAAPELARLLAAVRRYGDNTLFYIRYEDAEHPNGTVEIADTGLLIGYIDHFSHEPVTDKPLGAAHGQFLTLCRRAYDLWRDGQMRNTPVVELTE